MRIPLAVTLLTLFATPALAMPDMMLATPTMKLLFGFNVLLVLLIVFCLSVMVSAWWDRRSEQRLAARHPKSRK